jgi:hypothetical protein
LHHLNYHAVLCSMLSQILALGSQGLLNSSWR